MNTIYRQLRPYLRGLPIIVFALILGVLIAQKYLSYVTPMYESTVKLKLADTHEGVPNANLYKDLDVFVTTNKIAAEIELIKSKVILDQVIQELKLNVKTYRIGKIRNAELYQNIPFDIKYFNLDTTCYDKPFDLIVHDNQSFSLTLPNQENPIQGHFKEILETKQGTFQINLNDSLIASSAIAFVDHYGFEIMNSQKMYGQVLKNLDITSADKDVPIIRISYKDVNALRASHFVNKLALTYINDYIESKYKSANTTVNFLDDQIDKAVTKLTDSEFQIQNYRDVKGITNIAQETETDLRKISQLKIQQTNMKMNLEAVIELENYVTQHKGSFLELAPNFEAFTDLLSTEMVKKMKTLQSEKKDLLLTFTPNDERVKVIDEKINDLSSYLIESIHNTKNNLQTKYDNISSDIELAEQVFVTVPEKERMLTVLNREFNIIQDSYNFLNEKKIEAEIAQAAKLSFHRIITPASPSKDPISPNRVIITIISGLLAAFAAIFLIFIIHHVKAKVNDNETVERNSLIPIAVSTPKLIHPSLTREHFLRSINQLTIKGNLSTKNVICLTSNDVKEGSKFNAVELSKALYAQGKKVLLIDIGNQCKLFKAGFNGIMSTSMGFEALSLKETEMQTLTLPSLKDLIRGYLQEYDNVVVVNEPLDNGVIAKSMMSLSDMNLLVLDCRLTPVKKVAEYQLMQHEYQFPSTHFLLNRVNYSPSLTSEIIQLFQVTKKLVSRITHRK